jgi:hypothetical protein
MIRLTFRGKTSILLAAMLVPIIYIACRKTDHNRSETTNATAAFNTAAAKEWFYGTFKKSKEFLDLPVALDGKKLPHWQGGQYKKLGNTELVEYPLVQQIKRVPVTPASGGGVDARLAEATITKAVFVKKNGKTALRLVQWLPDAAYAQAKGYDISQNSLLNTESDFTGKVLITRWDGLFIKGYQMENGRKTRAITQLKKKVTTDYDVPATNTPINPDCIYSYYAWAEQNCTVYPQGDNITVEVCGDWELIWDDLQEVSCPIDQSDCESMGLSTEDCLCQTLGLCNGDDDQIDCAAQIDGEFENIQTSSEMQTSNWVSNDPNSRVVRYKWKFVESNPGSLFQWNYVSIDDGYHKKVNNEWRYDTIKHITVQKNIEPSIAFVVDCRNVQPHAYVGIYYASMELSYQIYQALICKGSPIDREGGFTSSKIFSVSETP